jgi:iron complex outermembrane receptor protein
MMFVRFDPGEVLQRLASLLVLLSALSVAVAQDTASTPAADQGVPKIHREETIVVTGTFAPVPLEEVDRSVATLPVRQLEPLFSTWVDYVQLDPALDLQQRAASGIQGDLSIRGASFGQTLVLIDGVRVDDSQTGHHNLDLPLPLASLDRIEVLSGAGSTFYGSDAVGGAINFITAPPDHSEFRFGSAVGNFGTNEQTASVSYVAPRWSEQLSFARDFSSGFRPDRDYRGLVFSSRSVAKTAMGHTNVLLAYSDRPFGADQFYGDFNSWERTKAWFASVGQELGPNTEASFAFRRHTDLFVLYRDRPLLYTNDHATEAWQLALRRKQTLQHAVMLSYGAEAYRDSIDSNNLGQHARNRGAAYVNFDIRALRRFSFSAGGREEFYASTRSQFSPTVAAGFWIREGLKLRASASRAFRLPTYTDLYYRDPATIGNPLLRPESAWSYEAGLVWERFNRVRAAVTVFQRREHDGIDYVQFTAAGPWEAANIQRLRFTGVETSLTLRLPRAQQIVFAYSGLHGAQDALAGLQSRYVFNYPIHNAVASWQGRLPMKLLARTRIGATERYARDPYGIWDVALSRSFAYVTTRFGLTNITDTGYEEIKGVPMPGRSVMFGLEFVIPKPKG